MPTRAPQRILPRHGFDDCRQESPMLARLAHLTNQHRWAVIGAWTFSRFSAAVAAGELSIAVVPEYRDPWQLRLRGEPADAERVGCGCTAPNVVVFHSSRVDVTKSEGVARGDARVARYRPGRPDSSYFSTGDRCTCRATGTRPSRRCILPGADRLDRHKSRRGEHARHGGERASGRDDGQRHRFRAVARKRRRPVRAVGPASFWRR